MLKKQAAECSSFFMVLKVAHSINNCNCKVPFLCHNRGSLVEQSSYIFQQSGHLME